MLYRHIRGLYKVVPLQRPKAVETLNFKGFPAKNSVDSESKFDYKPFHSNKLTPGRDPADF